MAKKRPDSNWLVYAFKSKRRFKPNFTPYERDVVAGMCRNGSLLKLDVGQVAERIGCSHRAAQSYVDKRESVSSRFFAARPAAEALKAAL